MPGTSIIVHGGAGGASAARHAVLRAGCARAARVGARTLAAGGSALDAVCAAVEWLEDDPEFNAGYGSVLNRDGVIEVDACVMTDALEMGAVAAVPWLRHPVRLARLVLEAGEHVLLCGAGALAFARERGIEPEASDALIAPRVRDAYAAERARRRPEHSADGGTVGACALDAHGRLAAATSTGGVAWKRSGRIGDSPIAGAGTYAERGAGAASATGEGEAILRAATTRRAVELLASGASADEAARAAIVDLRERGRGEGGLILLDRGGRPGIASSAPCMPWAWVIDGRAADGIASSGG